MADRFIGAVESLFRMTADDAATLANQLFAANKRAYEAAVNAQLEALGQDGSFTLRNRDELKRLKAEAVESARSIAQTYNEELAGRVDAVVEAERSRGLNRATLAKRLNDWDVERATWKAEQIRRTEVARTATGAVEAFISNSGLDTQVRYRLTPANSEYQHEDDLAAIAGELLTSNQLATLLLPAHPNERHVPIIAFPKNTDTEALWLGG